MSVGPILQVSRVHVLIELDSEKRGVYIIDSSTNGCWLNGKKLPQKQSGKVELKKLNGIYDRVCLWGYGMVWYGMNVLLRPSQLVQAVMVACISFSHANVCLKLSRRKFEVVLSHGEMISCSRSSEWSSMANMQY